MSVNKVIYGGNTLIDISDCTVTPETLAEGATAYDKSGTLIVGTATIKPPFQMPAYSGSHAIFGDIDKGYLEIYGNGDLTLSDGWYDVCVVGGGGGGDNYHAAQGGGGGYVTNYMGVRLEGVYSAIIGAGGRGGSSTANRPGDASSLGDMTSAGGKAGYLTNNSIAAGQGPGGDGAGSAGTGSPGGDGAYAFGDSTFKDYLYGGGGGGGSYGSFSTEYAGGAGGASGGGAGGRGVKYNSTTGATGINGSSAVANSGGGGGGSGYGYVGGFSLTTGNGGAGGSGIIIVRWGY